MEQLSIDYSKKVQTIRIVNLTTGVTEQKGKGESYGRKDGYE